MEWLTWVIRQAASKTHHGNFARGRVIGQTLDPLYVVTALATLIVQPRYTRIAVRDYGIHFQPPGLAQSFDRFYHLDNYEDLAHLGPPLQLLVEWYGGAFPALISLYNYAIMGLKCLEEAYKEAARRNPEYTNKSLLVQQLVILYTMYIKAALQAPSPVAPTNALQKKCLERWQAEDLENFVFVLKRHESSGNDEEALKCAAQMLTNMLQRKKEQLENIIIAHQRGSEEEHTSSVEFNDDAFPVEKNQVIT